MTESDERRAIISIVSDNEPGVLARIAGMLSGRGYNIDSLTVAPIDRKRARFTILTTGSTAIVEQIIAQLGRLIPVHSVFDLNETEDFVARELALIKLRPCDVASIDMVNLAEIESIRTIRSHADAAAIFELTGTTQQIDRFLTRLTSAADIEIVRTGIAAISTKTHPLDGIERSESAHSLPSVIGQG